MATLVQEVVDLIRSSSLLTAAEREALIEQLGAMPPDRVRAIWWILRRADQLWRRWRAGGG